ncbi:MAG: hypothetical protein V2I82_05025 [Halieaceae bacterium]|nr:hypothetical protein [Halieaceae bacterium]
MCKELAQGTETHGTSLHPRDGGLFAGAAALALLCAVPASLADAGGDEAAQGKRWSARFLEPRHRLSVGLVYQDVAAGIRATVDGFDPVELKISDLGVDDRDYSYYLDYRYRFRPRWAVIGGAYSFSESGTRRAKEDFNYDGVVYSAGAELNTRLDVDAYILDVMYAVHRDERSELTVGGGLHALDLGAALSGSVSVDDRREDFRGSGTTVLAPVPNLRFGGTWVLSDRIALHGVGGWLSANVGEFSGDFAYAHLRLAYGLSRAVAVALGYQRTEIDVTLERSVSEANFDIGLNGFTVTFAYSF